jgi:hypothetical protein
MCTREIKARIAVEKAAFSKNKTLFTSKLDLELRKKLVRCFVRCGNLDSSETISDVPGKFCNVVLEKDGEDKLDGPHI